MSAKRIWVIAFLLASMAILSACGSSGSTTGGTATPQAQSVTPTPTVGSSAVATPTQECVMSMVLFYSNEPNSPVAPLQATIKAGLEAENVKVDDLQVQGEGETCANRSGPENNFCCMSTPITISLPVDDLKDREALGNVLGKVLKVFYGADDYRSGKVNVTFVASGGQEQLGFVGYAGQQALDKGLSGAALLDALANP
ncbi:MAG TPA: hypothetical protein VJ183_00980 [Chloroflexia bacterium]|nr:hypothetical protein [Chloroflexia bacterium]